MHDLLQAMGRAMVRHEAIHELGRQSRLWKYEDIFSILTNNTVSALIYIHISLGKYTFL